MNELFWTSTDREQGEFFRNMTDEQANAFVEQYLRLRDERLLALNRSYREKGGGNETDLDFSPDSLIPLWDWVVKQLRRREFTPVEREHLINLPAAVRQSYQKPLSEDSLILLNDVAYYFAEVLARNLEGVHWRVCNTKEKKYVDRNQPVLGGFGAGFSLGLNPREWVKTLARKALDREVDKVSLLDSYENFAHLLEQSQ